MLIYAGGASEHRARMVYHLRESMATTRTSRASIYALLQVHPAAPLELITAVYWRLVGRAGVSSLGAVSYTHLTLPTIYSV